MSYQCTLLWKMLYKCTNGTRASILMMTIWIRNVGIIYTIFFLCDNKHTELMIACTLFFRHSLLFKYYGVMKVFSSVKMLRYSYIRNWLKSLTCLSQNMCSYLWCHVNKTCTTKRESAAEGTICGSNKVKIYYCLWHLRVFIFFTIHIDHSKPIYILLDVDGLIGHLFVCRVLCYIKT